MLHITIENEFGKRLTLTGNRSYDLLRVDGLLPPNAVINRSVIANKDGSKFNSSRLDVRNIVFLIAPGPDLEENRVELYKFIKSNQYIKIYVKTKKRNVYIEGKVESCTGDLFENPQKLQVSVICADPYFKNVKSEVIEFGTTENNFSFPWTPTEEGQPLGTFQKLPSRVIYNDSDTEIGVIFEITMTGDFVLEPVLYNTTTGKRFIVAVEMAPGDKIIIDTRRGKKSYKLINGGVETSLMNRMQFENDFIQLVEGLNTIKYEVAATADNAIVNVRITLEKLYQGV